MKKRITLSIEEELIERAKRVSKKRGKTLSQAVEDHFRILGIFLRDELEKENKSKKE